MERPIAIRGGIMNRWLNLLLIIVGVALLALMVWLDVHDGSPTMKMGDQPIEVVLAGALGFAALGNGLYRFCRSFKRHDDRHRKN
ncbi:hypothetical protein [Microbacterium sp. NPDC087665]|uniref:hypothetical protein n=1 Tax=Microbacterium sp. NPDC087665 TaxID=3364194 RepID=UPI0038133ECE